MARRDRLLLIIAGSIVALLIAAYVALSVWATLVVKGDFYDALGMGSAYTKRWETMIVLWVAGFLLAAAISAPLLFLGTGGSARGRRPPPPGPHPGELASEEVLEAWTARREAVLEWELAGGRRGARRTGAVPWALVFAGWAGLTLILTLAIGGRLAAERDTLLAAMEAVSFGQKDPIFGLDISFHVFTVPAVTVIVSAIFSALILALIAVVATGVLSSRAAIARGHSLRGRAIIERTTTVGFVYGGLIFISGAVLEWFGRYGLLTGGDDTIAGAGRAAREVDIPARTVAAVVLLLIGIGLLALAVPAVRERARPRVRGAVYVTAGVWIAISVVLAVVASPWLILLAIPAAALGYATIRAAEQDADLATYPVPFWSWPVLAVVTAIVVTLVGPAGAAFYDAVLLRGSKLQQESQNIQLTLDATRHASGIDQAEVVDADYRPNGVTQAAIDAAPASVGSLRFLDEQQTEPACQRLQTINQFYTCSEVDVDRYVVEGQRRTVFAMGREIDYTRTPDFQQRHFVYTHGYGLVTAAVNDTNTGGQPDWIARNIPQEGLDPNPEHPELYFVTQTDPPVPWAMVNTTQPVFEGTGTQPVTWDGTTGVPVGSGLRRLAITKFLGGLPYIGGGRRIWNATSGKPAGPESQLLIYRDIQARAREIAPFLRYDSDPYFTSAGGKVYVVLNAYAATSRYPYSASFQGANYMRAAAIVVMDAYSGETHFYVVDEHEPITRTWRKVYPSVFDSMSEMPADLRAHIRYGEDLFNYQASALQRFHVTDVNTFFSNNEAWARTQETRGRGVQGDRVTSPARYTYAVLPGETAERFVTIQSFKPAAEGRGIGFSGWLAVDNEPDSYGKATILRFPLGGQNQLVSIDTFSSNVARNATISQELQTRQDVVVRGNVIVVPIGDGLLYTQPIYLDTRQDSLPTLYLVVVSFGDSNVYAGSTFASALSDALRASVEPDQPLTPDEDLTLDQLVRRAADAFDAYRAAFGRGDDAEAQRQFEIFRDALQQAREMTSPGSGAAPPPDTAGTDTTGTATTGTETTSTETAPPESSTDQTAEVQPLDTATTSAGK